MTTELSRYHIDADSESTTSLQHLQEYVHYYKPKILLSDKQNGKNVGENNVFLKTH